MKNLLVLGLFVSSGFAFGDALEELTKRVEALEKAVTQTWNCTVVCKLWESGYADTFKGPFHASAPTAAEALTALNTKCFETGKASNYKNYYTVTAENYAIGASVKSSCSK